MTAWLMAILVALVGAAVPQGTPLPATVSAPQGSAAKLRIVEPTSELMALGPQVIRIRLEPASQPVRQLTIFADGRMVCRLEEAPFECPWNAGPDLREHTVKAIAVLAGGRKITADVTTKGGDVNLKEDVKRILVTVSVTDGDRFVTGLRKEHFKVYEDGVLMKTDFFDPSQSTLEVAIGVDISESMRESIGDVKENVKRFLAKLRPEDRATVGAFNEEYYVAAAPDLERSVQMKKVGQLASWGMTSLYDVILRSFDQLGGKPGRHALVIFTDGDDTASRASRQAVEKRVARNDAGLFIIGQGNAQKQGDLRALCDRLATKSGGMAFFPTDATSLARAFDRIADELAHQYLLTYEPRSVKADGRERRLKVEVAGGYQVRHAEGYTPK